MLEGRQRERCWHTYEDYKLWRTVASARARFRDGWVGEPAQSAKPTGHEVNIDGYVDSRGIRYIGKAVRMSDGTWRALANYHGILCAVEVNVKGVHKDTGGEGV